MSPKHIVPVLSLICGGAALAADAPRDVVADPGVYKALVDHLDYRLVEATWKPGQRDAFHSHPAQAYYWVTPCKLRQHFPDGTTKDFTLRAGQSGEQEAIASHSVENIGKSACKVVMVEAK